MKQNNPDAQVSGLLHLARNRSANGRETLVAIAADLVHGRGNVLSKPERMVMLGMLRGLIDGVERSVRAALAGALAELPAVGKGAAAAFAQNDVAVAYPILLESGVLGDLELIELVRHKTLQHQLAIARRRGISDQVSLALAALGDLDGDDVARGGADRGRDEGELPRIQPWELNPAMARRICLWVCVAVRQHTLENHKIDEVALDDALEIAVEEVTSSGAWGNGGGMLDAEGNRLPESPESLVQLLRAGNVAEFESMLSGMSGIRPTLLSRMIYEPGGESLATICLALNISRRTFAALFLLSRETGDEAEPVGAQEVAQAMSFYDRINPVAAKRVVARWRRNADYLNAIREVTASPALAS